MYIFEAHYENMDTNENSTRNECFFNRQNNVYTKNSWAKAKRKTILSSQWYSINRLLKELRSESEECWKKFKQKYSFSQTPALLVFEKGKCVSSVECGKDGLPVVKNLKIILDKWMEWDKI